MPPASDHARHAQLEAFGGSPGTPGNRGREWGGAASGRGRAWTGGVARASTPGRLTARALAAWRWEERTLYALGNATLQVMCASAAHIR